MKHDHTKCEKCRFWGSFQKWCNYGDIMGRSRLKDGGHLLPEGGCDLFEEDGPGEDTQKTVRDNWAAGKTNGEAWARALSEERKEASYRMHRMKTNRRHPEETYVRMEALYRQGKNDYAIAREAGVSRSCIQYWRKVNGLRANGRK